VSFDPGIATLIKIDKLTGREWQRVPLQIVRKLLRTLVWISKHQLFGV
jgi:hypothetical protein